MTDHITKAEFVQFEARLQERHDAIMARLGNLPCESHSDDILLLRLSRATLAGYSAGVSMIVSTVVTAVGLYFSIPYFAHAAEPVKILAHK